MDKALGSENTQSRLETKLPLRPWGSFSFLGLSLAPSVGLSVALSFCHCLWGSLLFVSSLSVSGALSYPWGSLWLSLSLFLSLWLPLRPWGSFLFLGLSPAPSVGLSVTYMI